MFAIGKPPLLRRRGWRSVVVAAGTEMIRAGDDQTLTINPGRPQYVYQCMDPGAGGDDIALPWRTGLLTP